MTFEGGVQWRSRKHVIPAEAVGEHGIYAFWACGQRSAVS